MVNEPLYCSRCRPDLFPSESRSPVRAADGHFAVRFGDWPYPFPYYNDEELGNCYELLCGEQGWAIVYATDEQGRLMYCPNCSAQSGPRPAETVLHGHVRVERTMDIRDHGCGGSRGTWGRGWAVSLVSAGFWPIASY